jgi:hypothetical protein
VDSQKRMTKQELIDEICGLLRFGPYKLGVGSSEPAEFLSVLAQKLGVDVVGAHGKPEVARAIVESSGLQWTTDCDSSSSKSGGGSTVTTIGIGRLLQATRRLKGIADAQVVDGLDIRPGLELLLGYRYHGYKIWYALAELVDNSISSFRISKKKQLIAQDVRLSVSIRFDEENRKIAVTDNAGGISADRLEAALTAGKRPDDLSDLNQFGFGLKAAGFWFGSQIIVQTRPVGANQSIFLDVDLKEMIDTGVPLVPSVTRNESTDHGTTITLARLWPERSMPEGRTLGKVRSYLASIYRHDLVAGEISIEVDGVSLEPPKHSVLEAPRWDLPESKPLHWEKPVDIDFRGKRVTGTVWLLERGDTANAGLVLSWKGKAIVGAGAGADDANDSFRPHSIYGRSNSFVSQRLTGELDMSDFPVTSTKDNLEWTEEEMSDFSLILRETIDSEPLPLIKMALMYRKRIKPADVKEDIETAGQSLVDALATIDPREFEEIDFSILEANTVDQDQSRSSTTAHIDQDSGLIADAEVDRATFIVPPFMPGMTSASLVFLHDSLDKRVVRWRKNDGNTLVIEINRASRFMENYASLPQFHLEPVVRMLAAFVILEIELAASGSGLGQTVNTKFNQLLNRSLGLPVLPRTDVDPL